MKTAKQVPQADAPSEEQLAAFIDKFDAKNAALIWSVRKLLQKRLPTANELVYDNYNFFVIGYCSTERPSDCILSIAAGANGVGLSFYHGATLPDPHRLLLGSGNQSTTRAASEFAQSRATRTSSATRCGSCTGRPNHWGLQVHNQENDLPRSLARGPRRP